MTALTCFFSEYTQYCEVPFGEKSKTNTTHFYLYENVTDCILVDNLPGDIRVR